MTGIQFYVMYFLSMVMPVGLVYPLVSPDNEDEKVFIFLKDTNYTTLPGEKHKNKGCYVHILKLFECD